MAHREKGEHTEEVKHGCYHSKHEREALRRPSTFVQEHGKDILRVSMRAQIYQGHEDSEEPENVKYENEAFNLW